MTGEIPPAIGDFPAGSQIASYRIEQLIGRGGMAVVYRASDVRLDRQVALKVLTQELGRDTAFRQRFILESRSAAAVDHPNVIPVFEAGEAEGVLFIAMRYVAGQDVRALVERAGRLPAARVVNIVSQVASALDAAHAHGLIHRDVKPANMLLGTVSDGRSPDHVYLSDFGLSKQSLATSSLTSTGQFLGTLDYMSPEQIEGRTVDGRTDLYALGCAAFEMLVGEPPFRREQNLAVMWAQISAAPPSVRQWRPDLSAEVDRVLARAMAKSPDDRQATCLEFASELWAACVPSTPARPAAPAEPARPPTELARAVPAPTGLPPVSGAPIVGQEQTVTENTPTGVRGQAPGGHPGFAMTSPGPAPAVGPGTVASPAPVAGPAPVSGQGPAGGPGPAGRPGPTAQMYPGAPSYPPVPPPRRRRRTLPLLFGLVVIIGGVAAALVVPHLLAKNHASPKRTVTITHTATPPPHSHTPPGSPSQTATPPPLNTPQQVVTAFYNDINAHQYRQAYALNDYVHNQPFATWKQGYVTTTQHVDVKFGATSGDVISVTLTALQTDGTYKYYQGTYTVQNGVIVSANIT